MAEDDYIAKAAELGIDYDFNDESGKKKHHKTIEKELREAIEKAKASLSAGDLPENMPPEIAARELALRAAEDALPSVPAPEPDDSGTVLAHYRDGYRAWMTKNAAEKLIADGLVQRYEATA